VTQLSLSAAQSGEQKLVHKTNIREMNANMGGEDFNLTGKLLLVKHAVWRLTAMTGHYSVHRSADASSRWQRLVLKRHMSPVGSCIGASTVSDQCIGWIYLNWEFTLAKDRQGMLHPQANDGDFTDETITIIPT
jgi:hypothetical protein